MTQLNFCEIIGAHSRRVPGQDKIDEGAWFVRMGIARRNQVRKYLTEDQVQHMQDALTGHCWIDPAVEYEYWENVLIELGVPAED